LEEMKFSLPVFKGPFLRVGAGISGKQFLRGYPKFLRKEEDPLETPLCENLSFLGEKRRQRRVSSF